MRKEPTTLFTDGKSKKLQKKNGRTQTITKYECIISFHQAKTQLDQSGYLKFNTIPINQWLGSE